MMSDLNHAVDSLDPDDLPRVAGRKLPTALYLHVRRALVIVAEEQRKPNPDSALIGVLCDSVRLTRELSDFIGFPIPGESRREVEAGRASSGGPE